MNTTQTALTRNHPKRQPVQWKKSLNEIEEMVCRQTERHIRIIQTGRNAIRIEDKVGLDLVLEHVYDDGLLFGYRLPFGLNAIAKTAGKILAGRVRTKKLNWDAESGKSASICPYSAKSSLCSHPTNWFRQKSTTTNCV